MTDKILCKYYMNGACQYGASCRFSHEMSNLPNLVCKYYLQGNCTYGDKCRYDHVRPQWQPREEPSAAGSAAPSVPRPSTEPDANVRLAPLWPSWRPDQTAAAPRGAPAASQNAWQQPQHHTGGWHDDSQEGDFWADQDAFAADLQPLQWRQGSQGGGSGHPSSARSRSLGQHSGDPDMDDVWAEQAAFEADLDAMQGGSGQHNGASAADPDQEADHEDMWRDMAAFEAEMDAMHSAGTADGPASAVPRVSGLNPSAASFSFTPAPAKAAPQLDAGWTEPDAGEDAIASAAQPSQASEARSRGLCPQYRASGSCSSRASCQYAHGDLCEVCGKHALHPSDEAERAAHSEECTARHQRLAARARSEAVECGICLEKVLEKQPPSARKFGLLSCEHPFCLGCIKSWRSNTDGIVDLNTAVRTCPICRTVTHFVTPSTVWPATEQEKASILDGYHAKLGAIDCKYFDFGKGTCPFSTSCFYRHVYADGRKWEPILRKLHTAGDGEEDANVSLMQAVRLSDFLETPSATRALRRAGNS